MHRFFRYAEVVDVGLVYVDAVPNADDRGAKQAGRQEISQMPA